MNKPKGDNNTQNGAQDEVEFVSANALRARLYETFKNSGVENALKVQYFGRVDVCVHCIY